MLVLYKENKQDSRDGSCITLFYTGCKCKNITDFWCTMRLMVCSYINSSTLVMKTVLWILFNQNNFVIRTCITKWWLNEEFNFDSVGGTFWGF